MPPTLAQVSQLLDTTGVLYHKVRGAVIKSASVVYAEAPETANHANRLLWAQDVLLTGNVDGRTKEMYRLAMTNSDIIAAGEEALDIDVEWVVGFFLNTVAGGV
jgi:hypothetical protein